MRKLRTISVFVSSICALTGLMFITIPVNTPYNALINGVLDILMSITPLRSGSLEFRLFDNHTFGVLLYGAIGLIFLAIGSSKERSLLRVQILTAFFTYVLVRNGASILIEFSKIINSLLPTPITKQQSEFNFWEIMVSLCWLGYMIPTIQHCMRVWRRFIIK